MENWKWFISVCFLDYLRGAGSKASTLFMSDWLAGATCLAYRHGCIKGLEPVMTTHRSW